MLRIYPVILSAVEEMQPVVRRIELRDREPLACLELAQRCCAVAPPASLGAQLNQIIGTLVRLVAA